MPARKKTDVPTPDTDLTSGEISALLGVQQRTLNIWADRGVIPHTWTPGGARRFRPREVAASYTRRGEEVPRDLARFIGGEPVLALPAADVRRVPTEQLRAELARREQDAAPRAETMGAA